MARFGYIREKREIKFLTLYAMNKFPFPVNEKSVLDVCLIDEAFGYLEFEEAFKELIETGHILQTEVNGEKLYEITEIGRFAAKEFEKQIPLSVREKAEKYATRIIHSIRRDEGIHTEITERSDGMMIANMSMGEKDDIIMELKMTMLNKEQCSMLIKGFRERAEKIYDTILHSLIYDENSEQGK